MKGLAAGDIFGGEEPERTVRRMFSFPKHLTFKR